jgi:hypothetical protein
MSDAFPPALRERAMTPALDRAVQAFRAAGALSPADARPLTAIPGLDPVSVVTLAARGVVREAEPGRFFLYADTEHERRSLGLTAVLIGAASIAAVFGLPLLAWYFSR